MEQRKIDRINELAKISASRALTPEEAAEQASLREEYREEFRRSMRAILDNTSVERPDGTREKCKRNGNERNEK